MTQRFQLSVFRRLLLLAMPFLVLATAYGVPVWIIKKLNQQEQDHANLPIVAPLPPSGAELFAKHCAYCHGSNGEGNGVAHLSIKARHFGYEKYKFGSTDPNVPTPTNRSAPTDDDLLGILKRGIPGSSMPSFAQLNDEELQALVAHVRSLTRSGTYKKLFDVQLKRAADGEDDDPEPPIIAKQVEQFTRIGTPITVPTEIPAASEERLANGKRVFAQICANCHGPEGKGDGKQVLDPKFKNDNGTPATPRDLTQGVYKGGESFGNIYTRIHLGIPGTPMPSSAQALNQKDMTDLVLFIQSLAKKVPSGSTIASR